MADHRELSFGAEGEAASGLPSLPRSPSPGAKLPSPTPSDELRRLADPVNTSVFAAAEAVTQTGAATAAEGSSSPDFYEDVNREFPFGDIPELSDPEPEVSDEDLATLFTAMDYYGLERGEPILPLYNSVLNLPGPLLPSRLVKPVILTSACRGLGLSIKVLSPGSQGFGLEPLSKHKKEEIYVNTMAQQFVKVPEKRWDGLKPILLHHP